jgi:predicted amidophosphoribosyltransferase
MKLLMAGKIKKTEMGSGAASFKIAPLCVECGQRAAGSDDRCPDCSKRLLNGDDKKAENK